MLGIQILICIICSVVGYLFGSISSGIILSRKIYKKDIRELGSKNSGATNMGRIFGLKVGFIVIILDMLKTAIPIWICYFILKFTALSNYNLDKIGFLIAGLSALIGHCYPIYHKFKGGKAVSSFAGIIASTSWILIPIGLFLFLLLLKIQKKVSLTSIIVSITLSILSIPLIFLPNYLMNFGIEASIYYTIILFISSLILIFRHKENIKRIINGEESKIKWMK